MTKNEKKKKKKKNEYKKENLKKLLIFKCLKNFVACGELFHILNYVLFPFWTFTKNHSKCLNYVLFEVTNYFNNWGIGNRYGTDVTDDEDTKKHNEIVFRKVQSPTDDTPMYKKPLQMNDINTPTKSPTIEDYKY